MAYDVARFEETEIRIHDAHGDRWVTVKDQAAALGYGDPRSFQKLVQEMEERSELRQGVHFRFIPLSGQETKVLSYRGVIRTAMRSDAPRAIAFRDWAEEVLFQVMTKGSYTMPGAGDNKRYKFDALTPSEELRIAEMRCRCWMALAKDPRSKYLWQALYSTFGGRMGYAEYLRSRGLYVPQTAEEWDAFENSQNDDGPGDDWFGGVQ